MSRIQSVNQNYQQTRTKFNGLKTNYASSQNFSGGNPAELSDSAKTVYDACEKKILGKKFGLTWIGEQLAIHDSEIEKQLINALFTATLAPIVIGWNPFSKQDDKTKKYMALRQPISAVVAIAGGVALTKPIDDWLAKIGSEGCVPGIDMRMAPDKSYIQHQFKRDKGMLKGNKLSKLDYVKAVQDETKKVFTKLISENPDNIIIEDKTNDKNVIDKVVSIVKRDKNGTILSTEEVVRNIPNINSQTELDAFLEVNNLHKVTMRDFLKDHLKFEFFEDGKFKPDNINKKLKDVKAMDFLEKLGIKGFTEQELNTALDKMRLEKKTLANIKAAMNPKSKADTMKNLKELFGKDEQLKPHVDDIMKELDKLTKTSDSKVEVQVEEICKQVMRMMEGQLGEGLLGSKKLTLGQLLHKLGYIDDEGDIPVSGLQEKVFDKDVATVIDELKTKLEKKLVSSGGEKAKKLEFFEKKTLPDFAKNIMDNKVERIGTRFKAFKGYVGIISNLFIVVVTCTALNWLYPRIVERLFPNLVKNDKPAEAPKGGNK